MKRVPIGRSRNVLQGGPIEPHPHSLLGLRSPSKAASDPMGQRSIPKRLHNMTLGIVVASAVQLFGQSSVVRPAVLPDQSAQVTQVVIPSLMDSHQRWLLEAHGDRLTRAGRERVTLVATVSKPDSASGTLPVEAQIVYQLPLKLRYSEVGSQSKTLIFDGSRASGSLSADSPDLNLMDTLVADREDFFFFNLIAGCATRFYGSGFPLQGSNDAFDAYEIVVPDRLRNGALQQKVFLFDTDTGLLRRVNYHLEKSGGTLEISTRLDGWNKVDGQPVPGAITRYENDVPVLTITIHSVVFGPSQNDGIFDLP